MNYKKSNEFRYTIPLLGDKTRNSKLSSLRGMIFFFFFLLKSILQKFYLFLVMLSYFLL